MEFRIERSKLLHSLQHIHQVAERKNTIEILRNVLLEGKDGLLHVTATDTDTTVTETLECDIDQPGEKTVSASMLFDIVRKLPEGSEILFKAEENSVNITVAHSFFKLASLPREEFPSIDSFEINGNFAIPAASLLGLIDNTLFAAASTSEVRYYLNGVYLHYHADTNTLRSVATNGHRLARHQIPAPEDSAFLENGIILPRKTLVELKRLLEGYELDVRLEVGEVLARFTIGTVVLTCKLIAGTYPDYQRVIPEIDGSPLIINANAFFSGVNRVSTISSVSQSNAVKFTLGAESLTLEAVDQNKNIGQEEIRFSHDMTPFDTGFNAAYLLDISQRISSEHVRLWFPASNGIAVICGEETEDSLFVIMPTRT